MRIIICYISNRYVNILASYYRTFLILSLLASTFIQSTTFAATIEKSTQAGIASYYTYESCRREGTSGVWTASGEAFNENEFTCALPHRDFGGYYKVTNIATGKSCVVRHNDLGPNKKLVAKGRIIDLSKAAFEAIADLRQGLIEVKITKIGGGL